MKITDNSDNIQCSNPIEVTIEDQKGFIVIDSNFNVLFKSNLEVPSKCGEYVLLKVTTPLHNTENCENETETPIDACTSVISFVTNPQRTRQGANTLFEISVLGAGTNIVQFKSPLEDWKDATIGTNAVSISALSTGQCANIQARIKNCTNVVTNCFTTLEPLVIPVPVVEEPEEIELGTITFSPSNSHLLIIKQTGTTKWFLQTDANRTYYKERGLNLRFDSRVILNRTYDWSTLANEVNTPLGGLFSSSTGEYSTNWPLAWWASNGYTIQNGEWKVSSVPVPIPVPVPTPIPVPTPVPVPVDSGDKINVPFGLIMWDNWERDYWNDENPEYSKDINHISKNRLAATEWKHLFKLVPFYGQHTAPELITIRYNVRWDPVLSPVLGRNVYDEVQKYVTVKFDKTAEDTAREVRYYADAGISWLCFNYYSNESYLSNTRRQFVALNNKYGMKMTFMLAKDRTDEEVNYIVNLMKQDYWFRINGKPVLYFNSENYPEEQRYRNALRNAGGGEMYLVYYAFGGAPGDVTDIINKNPQACSAYSQTANERTVQALIDNEVTTRRTWLNQFGHTWDLIPNITLGLEELGLRTSIDPVRGPGMPACGIQDIHTKLNLVKQDLATYNTDRVKIPAILCYSGTEIIEGGLSAVPKLNEDGSIDNSVLDAMSVHL